MKDQELFKKLNNLQEIKADNGWKIRQREILIKQICSSEDLQKNTKSRFFIYFELPYLLVRDLSQPTMAAILIFLFLTSSAFASVKIAGGTKPGDSLYIAKIISEKAQLAMTFNDKEKARLGIEFAGNRIEEMNKILAEPSNTNNEIKVGELLNNFKKEISSVKTRIARINPNIKQVTKNENQEQSNIVVGANLNKEDKGIQISDQNKDNSNVPADNIISKEKEAGNETVTTTQPVVDSQLNTATSSLDAPANQTSDTANILKEAEKLLGEEKYSDTLVKLDEADKSITQVNEGEVKGVSESATSTIK